MGEQVALYAVKDAPKKSDNLRRRWENGFQKWSNEKGNDGSTPEGVCGFGIICDYCEDIPFEQRYPELKKITYEGKKR